MRSANLEIWYNNLKAAACAAARVQGTRFCANAQGFENIEPCKTAAGAVLLGPFAAEIFDLPGGIPLQLFDAHMHYSDTHGPAFDAVRERHGVGACTLACIPQMGVCSTVPDALYYKAVHPEELSM